MNRILTKYWIKINTQEKLFHLGIGVTAYSKEDMLNILRDKVAKQIDIESIRVINSINDLDQNHVVPNMEEFVFRGIWYPIGLK